MNNVLISVIIPTYKRNDNLKRAINSVLLQKGDYEIIVVDDNDPNTKYRRKNELLMKKFSNIENVIYLKHDKNKNGAFARNTGIRNSHGQYITFLDDDDEFLENRIVSIQEVIENNNYDLMCTGIIMKRNGLYERKVMPNIVGKSKERLIFELLCQKSFFETGSNIICKKEIIDKIEGFDTRFLRHQDMEFAIRMLENSDKIYVINNYTVVKNNDDRINIPDFNRMLSIKKLYLEKFEYIIKKYSSKDKNRIYEANYYQLLKNAYNNKDKNDIKKCINFLKEEGLYNYYKDKKIYFKISIKNLKFVKKIRNFISK